MLEAFTFQNRVTGRSVTQLTFGEMRFVHGYYDVPPWSPTDGRIADSVRERCDRNGAALCDRYREMTGG